MFVRSFPRLLGLLGRVELVTRRRRVTTAFVVLLRLGCPGRVVASDSFAVDHTVMVVLDDEVAGMRVRDLQVGDTAGII